MGIRIKRTGLVNGIENNERLYTAFRKPYVDVNTHQKALRTTGSTVFLYSRFA